jgi:hypothetical protein
MLMQELDEWKIENDLVGCEIDETLFNSFMKDTHLENSLRDVISCLAYQIYELQVCVEGMLEDE